MHMNRAYIAAKDIWQSPEVKEIIAKSISGETRLALFSVFNKEGIDAFAKELIDLGWQIISTGGTRKALEAAKIPVWDVAEFSGIAPQLDHRVATLVPEVHGGLLATPDMRAELQKWGYPWIDKVCVDLYPLENEIRRPGATRASVKKLTDMGGIALIRSAAKGDRIVIADAHDRAPVLDWLRAGEPDPVEFRNQLAAKAEHIAGKYCLASSEFLEKSTA